MSVGLLKMWIAFFAMFLMVVSMITIYFSRHKLKGFWRGLTATVAYVFVIISGILMVFIVFSNPH